MQGISEEDRKIIEFEILPFLARVRKNPSEAFTLRITGRKGEITGFQVEHNRPNGHR